MLQDYVTKQEFADFRDEMRDFRDEVNERFGEMNERLGTFVTKQEFNERFVEFRKDIAEQFNRTAGMVLDQMRHEFGIAVEYLEHVVRGDDNAEVRKRFKKVFYNK